jgi:acetylornithine/N-succinyldiaminopimelate aminotransferase
MYCQGREREPTNEKEYVLSVDEAQRLEQEHYLQLYRRYPLTLVRGEGTRVFDAEGREYIDVLAGIAVNSVGHCHPRVVEAIQRQAASLIHVSNFYYNKPQSELAQKLTALSGMERAFFCNSGAEAVEGALKLARKAASKEGRRGAIISLEGCFHGRTLATVATGQRKYQEGFEPIPAGFVSVPLHDLQAMEEAADKGAIAVIIEPVQGEGGVRPLREDYLQEVRRLCDKKGMALILDEVQCGIGRTGTMFAYQGMGIEPDILTSAKALGGGFPIGALLARGPYATAFDYGNHGTTFGGGPLACAAALATLQVIEEEGLLERAAQLGDYARTRLEEAARHNDSIREVRGKGLMLGVDLTFPGKDVVLRMMDRGVLANCTADTVIRLVPPLTITQDELDRVLQILLESLAEKVKP